LPQLKKDYISTGKVVFIYLNFPLSFHDQATQAAEAAACAGQQGKFWEMHDQLYLNQAAWADNDAALSVFLGYGLALGLDQTAYQSCLGNHDTVQRIQEDVAFGFSVQVSSTPSFVFSGQGMDRSRGMAGLGPYTTFQQVIDAALK
jgi:protein-disulfide isomerase